MIMQGRERTLSLLTSLCTVEPDSMVELEEDAAGVTDWVGDTREGSAFGTGDEVLADSTEDETPGAPGRPRLLPMTTDVEDLESKLSEWTVSMLSLLCAVKPDSIVRLEEDTPGFSGWADKDKEESIFKAGEEV